MMGTYEGTTGGGTKEGSVVYLMGSGRGCIRESGACDVILSRRIMRIG